MDDSVDYGGNDLLLILGKGLEDIVFDRGGIEGVSDADTETPEGLSSKMLDDRFNAMVAGGPAVKLESPLPYR